MNNEAKFEESQQQLQSLLRDVMRTPLQEYQGELVSTIDDIGKQIRIVPSSVADSVKSIQKFLEKELSKICETSNEKCDLLQAKIVSEANHLNKSVKESTEQAQTNNTERLNSLLLETQKQWQDILLQLSAIESRLITASEGAEKRTIDKLNEISAFQSIMMGSVSTKIKVSIAVSIVNAVGLIILGMLLMGK